MIRPLAAPAILAALLVPASASAADRLLDPMFADHAVIQRDRPIEIWGRAAPGETISVKLGDARAQAKAGPDGAWRATLPAMKAGGPYALSARAGGGAVEAADLLVGDVFVCSGQSNMEWPVGAAVNGKAEVASSADAGIRLLTIPQLASATPVTSLAAPAAWKPAGPDTVGDFSAACFFMAQALRKQHPAVPLGLIDNSWGGSAIEAWLSPAAWQAAQGDPAALALVGRFAADPAGANREWGAKWETWWAAYEKDPGEATPWAEDFQPGAAWRKAPSLTNWETWGIPELEKYDGMMWYRTHVTLTAAQAGQAATLALGPVDDVDETWVDGHAIGYTSNASAPRRYALPAGALHAGDNVIVVNALDVWGNGGMYGDVSRAIELADGSRVPLDGDWLYRPVTEFRDQPPRAPWDSIAGVTTIYNGMVAPIGRWGVKGVAWYQGESNAWDGRGYEKWLRALIGDWRSRWGAALPVAIVQLPNYGMIPTQPVESGWADLRDSQRRVAAGDPAAALVVTIDVGDPANLHPPAKRPVGDRLARAMEHIAYGAKVTASGPLPVDARRTPSGIAIRFRDVEGRLGGGPAPFELCGADKGTCRPVEARVEATSVLLPADSAATRIRYCWGDAPRCGLRDSSLPATPFELEIR
ncbi:MAG: sialic acid-specific 9-O-acetylesterase [Alphaproteobacteria bacterium]|nr:sialic acid-specific 9-O-acetylesterase [Alphaproteobacteria bacterium]